MQKNDNKTTRHKTTIKKGKNEQKGGKKGFNKLQGEERKKENKATKKGYKMLRLKRRVKKR